MDFAILGANKQQGTNMHVIMLLLELKTKQKTAIKLALVSKNLKQPVIAKTVGKIVFEVIYKAFASNANLFFNSHLNQIHTTYILLSYYI